MRISFVVLLAGLLLAGCGSRHAGIHHSTVGKNPWVLDLTDDGRFRYWQFGITPDKDALVGSWVDIDERTAVLVYRAGTGLRDHLFICFTTDELGVQGFQAVKVLADHDRTVDRTLRRTVPGSGQP